MAHTAFDFMGLPAELRERIYVMAFTTDSSSSSNAIDILMLRQEVPNASALRRVSKFIWNESYSTYTKARKPIIAKRKQTVRDLVDEYEKAFNLQNPPQQNAMLLISLVDSLKSHVEGTGACRNHTCLSSDCYMCANPAHQRCFDCGRNLAVALYCKLHEAATPSMIIPDSEATVNPASLGHLIKSLPMKHTQRMATDPATGQQRLTMSWAWCWWATAFHTQVAIDLRCGIRKRAIKSFWRMYRQHRRILFKEGLIQRMESTDPRMPDFNVIKTKIGMGVIAWEDEYAGRAKKWAEAGDGTDYQPA